MNKSYLKSKTLWVSLICILAPIYPPIQDVVVANPEVVGMVVGGVFALLRLITGKPLVLKEDKGLTPNNFKGL